jgi:aspartyl-tRNA(Asn)/glutamyl-tRNA(Gln) amidotransferase subunit B
LPERLPVLNRRVVELGARAASRSASHQSAVDLCAQELLLSRPAEGLPDLAIRSAFLANGELEIMTAERDEAVIRSSGVRRRSGSRRLHLEEDAGKNVHEGLPDVDRYSYIDLNRAGVPLLRSSRA